MTRYSMELHPWSGIFGTFASSQGPFWPHEGLWFWRDEPERRPYIRRKARR